MTIPSTPTTTRIAALDVARGVAILGTFGTNVWIFTEPRGLVGYLHSVGTGPFPIRLLQALAQGKFLGLLSLMFGVGMAIQLGAARRRGIVWPGRYPRRAALLLIDGTLHFLFIAEFDVLMGYAVVSLIVSSLLILRPVARTRWIKACVALHLAMVIPAALALSFASTGGHADSGSEPNPYADGSFLDLVAFRWDNALIFRFEAVFTIPLTIAMFLVGARVYQAGLFTFDGARLRRRMMLLGAVAVPIDLALGVCAEPLGLGDAGVLLGRYVTAPVVALGLLALIAQAYSRRAPGLVGRAMGRVGSTALSCYVLQNLIASVLCYGWGLGLAQRFGTEHRLGFTAAVYVGVMCTLLVLATAWTRWFRRGPIEAVMHRLA